MLDGPNSCCCQTAAADWNLSSKLHLLGLFNNACAFTSGGQLASTAITLAAATAVATMGWHPTRTLCHVCPYLFSTNSSGGILLGQAIKPSQP
jgi:hypothetical protein